MVPTAKSVHEPKENQKWLFVLKGFRQESGSRVFEFEGIAPDRTRTDFTVKADLALSRSYGIQLQELPLLCRSLLDGAQEPAQELIYTEQDMRVHAAAQAAMREADQKKRQSRKAAAEES